ncbi:MAG TPA: STAS domain-containing protein [Steroidobacteraceae bacterium]|nr:STAS domain-containing protein [Steroidobacteraceae bacterium]
MQAGIRRDGDAIRMSGELTVHAVRDLKQPLLDALGGSARLDLSEVCEFDTAGLQLLLLACREAERAGQRLAIGTASNIVRETLVLAGCEWLLAPVREQAA